MSHQTSKQNIKCNFRLLRNVAKRSAFGINSESNIVRNDENV